MKLGLLPRPNLNFKHSGVRKILKLMVPTLFSSSAAQLNLLLDTVLASFLLTGSLTWLYLADRLLEFPLGVFAIALSTVILPGLSRHYAAKRYVEFRATIAWASRLGFLVGIPAAVGLGVMAEPIISLLFGHGRYMREDVMMAALALQAYSWGLPAFIFIKILAPAFYARQDTKTPVKIALVAIISNMFFNIVFLAMMLWHDGSLVHVENWQQLRVLLGTTPGLHTALAWASVTSAWLNMLGLAFWLSRSGYSPELSEWMPVLLKVALSSALMGGFLLWFSSVVPDYQSLFQQILWLFGTILAAVLVYVVFLGFVGIRLKHLRISSQ